MPLRPIDFQVSVSRTLEVSKDNSNERLRNQAMQQQQTTLVHKQVDTELRQVYQQPGVYRSAIREKQEKNNEGKNRKKRDRKKEKSTDGNCSGEPTVKINKLDITL